MAADNEFICEQIHPVAGAGDAAMAASGEPGLPLRFTWRDTEYRTVGVVRKWKTSSRERGGVEMYLRRHWYEIVTDPPARMVIYCDRQAKDRSHPKRRWFIYTINIASP